MVLRTSLDRTAPPRRCCLAAPLWLLLAGVLLASPGCGGCQNSVTADRDALKKKQEEEEKREREKPKPPFEPGKMVTQPNNLLTDRQESLIKPGHWTNVTFEMTANLDDFSGELVTDPFPLEGMPFELGTSRPVQLPKEQPKHLEVTLYVPAGRGSSRMITRRLLTGRRGREILQETFPTTMLPAHQFYFLVLAERPDSYSFLRETPAVDPPSDGLSGEANSAYYRVLLPHVQDRVPLPSNPLAWTSLAYVLWDNFDPTLLSPDQQQAMLDWLHWGGQLIVSGPSTLDDLKSSFLADYLPAASGEAIKLAAADLDVLNAEWPAEKPLNPLKPWTGVKLLVDPDNLDVQVLLRNGAGEPLLVERRVGRGGIVVSAFRLSQLDLRKWPAYDEFINASLLRRQPRRFSESGDGGIGMRVQWTSPDAWQNDPRRISGVGYFARDAALVPGTADWQAVRLRLGEATADYIVDAQQALTGPPPERDFNNTSLSLEDPLIGPGVAGWSDFNLPAELARKSLIEAAGISIPEASFVVRMLAIYLGVLVPLNWIVFRVLGRVELAWISVPILTVAFAVAVVHWAQLDIGFARSKKEVALIEFNGGFERAHVTRYTALYTSLSTSYDLQFDEPSALVQPFANHSRNQTPPRVAGQTQVTVHFRRAPPKKEDGAELDSSITLEGFEIPSNSLSMLHSEHMADLEGGIHLQGAAGGPQKLLNDSLLVLEAVAVVARGEDGSLNVAWVDALSPGSSAELSFSPAVDLSELVARWAAAVTAVPDVRPLLHAAAAETAAGETRLVAWTREEVPGMTVEPSTRQSDSAGVVLAHLRYPPRPKPQPDVVSKATAQKEMDRIRPPDSTALDPPTPVP